MEMVAGVEGSLNMTWPLRVPRQGIKIDHTVKLLAFPNPLIDRLTRLFFLREG
jgi:hypothetical protein